VKRYFFQFFLLTVITFFFTISCAPPKLDPLSMQIKQEDQEQVVIPDACKSQYKSKIYRVAVVPFLNNTIYGEMTVRNSQIEGRADINRRQAGAAGVIVGPGAAGLGYAGASRTDIKYSGNVNTFMRQIAPKIGEFAQSAVENTIVNLGGVDVFTRSQMQNVLDEQNFQMNLADQNTVVKFGKLAGVDYIISGSVDYINARYIPQTKFKDTGNAWLNLTQAVAKSMTEGWNVTTEMTIQLIDVATGQVLVSKKVRGRELGGVQPAFNPELIISAAKKAMGESVTDIKSVFSEIFNARGYINQLRGGKSVALISIGRSDGIKPGDTVEAYQFAAIKDFMTGEVECYKSTIPVNMIVTNQVNQNSAWVIIKGDESAKSSIKVGTLVERAPYEGQGLLDKLY